MMELATIRQHDIPVKIVVFRNNYLGMVREFQHYNYKDRYSVVDISGAPKLDRIAEAYDIPYLKLSRNEEIEAALDTFLKEDASFLMECMIDPMDLVK